MLHTGCREANRARVSAPRVVLSFADPMRGVWWHVCIDGQPVLSVDNLTTLPLVLDVPTRESRQLQGAQNYCADVADEPGSGFRSAALSGLVPLQHPAGGSDVIMASSPYPGFRSNDVP